VFFSYLTSFMMLGIYWSNHHHLIQAVKQVDGRVLWANLHLLFWLSLIPFSTAWVGDTHYAPWPVALYGAIFCLSGVAYYILTRALIALHGANSTLATAVGQDLKGVLSVAIYIAAIPLAFVASWISMALYVVVGVMWLIPDRRIERTMTS
jgi:uncharacterized membrane protein